MPGQPVSAQALEPELLGLLDKLGRTITGAAVLALTAAGAVTGTAHASTDVPDATGAIKEIADASLGAADDSSTDVGDSTSAAVADSVWTSRGWPAPSADPHLPDASGNIPADGGRAAAAHR